MLLLNAGFQWFFSKNVLSRWCPQIHFLPKVCRKMWMIICFLVTLNLLSSKNVFYWFLWAIITASLDRDLFWCWLHATFHTWPPAGRTSQRPAAEPEERSPLSARNALDPPSQAQRNRKISSQRGQRSEGRVVRRTCCPAHCALPGQRRAAHPGCQRCCAVNNGPAATPLARMLQLEAGTSGRNTVGSLNSGSAWKERNPSKRSGPRRFPRMSSKRRAPWPQAVRNCILTTFYNIILALPVITWMVFAFGFIFPAKYRPFLQYSGSVKSLMEWRCLICRQLSQIQVISKWKNGKPELINNKPSILDLWNLYN